MHRDGEDHRSVRFLALILGLNVAVLQIGWPLVLVGVASAFVMKRVIAGEASL